MLYALVALVLVLVVGNVARQYSARREELDDEAAARWRRARVRELRSGRDAAGDSEQR